MNINVYRDVEREREKKKRKKRKERKRNENENENNSFLSTLKRGIGAEGRDGAGMDDGALPLGRAFRWQKNKTLVEVNQPTLGPILI